MCNDFISYSDIGDSGRSAEEEVSGDYCGTSVRLAKYFAAPPGSCAVEASANNNGRHRRRRFIVERSFQEALVNSEWRIQNEE